MKSLSLLAGRTVIYKGLIDLFKGILSHKHILLMIGFFRPNSDLDCKSLMAVFTAIYCQLSVLRQSAGCH